MMNPEALVDFLWYLKAIVVIISWKCKHKNVRLKAEGVSGRVVQSVEFECWGSGICATKCIVVVTIILSHCMSKISRASSFVVWRPHRDWCKKYLQWQKYSSIMHLLVINSPKFWGESHLIQFFTCISLIAIVESKNPHLTNWFSFDFVHDVSTMIMIINTISMHVIYTYTMLLSPLWTKVKPITAVSVSKENFNQSTRGVSSVQPNQYSSQDRFLVTFKSVQFQLSWLIILLV